MSTVIQTHEDDVVRTIDMRPLAQTGANRAPDVDGPLARGSALDNSPWQERVRRMERVARASQTSSPERSPAAELAAQCASVFAYAMLGAVLFRAAMWWLGGQ